MSRSVLMLGSFALVCSPCWLGGQDCGREAIDLILQETPVPGQGHQTESLFAHAADTFHVPVSPGTEPAAVFGALVSRLEGGSGVQSWAIGVRSEGDIRITGGTTADTAAAPEPEGLFKGGFERTFLIGPYRDCPATLVSGVVLAFKEVVALEPIGTATILRVDVEPTMPPAQAPLRGRLAWVEDTCRVCPNIACGQPAPINVTVDGGTGPLCERRGAEVVFGEDRFRRGDANDDGRVDLSDAIRTFMYLFLGSAEPPCLDAGDSTDDGRVDIADGIHTLSDFFREGTDIPSPGPFTCGFDPTPDELGCQGSQSCR